MMRAILVGAGRPWTFIALAVALGALTVAVVSPARGLPAELIVHVVTADRNIECQMVDPNATIGNITCVMHSKGYTTRGDLDNHGLTARAHLQWFVDYSRPALVGSSRREVHGPKRILPNGRSLTVGHFRCVSRGGGLTCTSRHSGHGFFLSRARQRTF